MHVNTRYQWFIGLRTNDVLWWSSCTLYLHACQVRVTVGYSGLCCCTCVMYFKCWLTPLFVDQTHAHSLFLSLSHTHTHTYTYTHTHIYTHTHTQHALTCSCPWCRWPSPWSWHPTRWSLCTLPPAPERSWPALYCCPAWLGGPDPSSMRKWKLQTTTHKLAISQITMLSLLLQHYCNNNS